MVLGAAGTTSSTHPFLKMTPCSMIPPFVPRTRAGLSLSHPQAEVVAESVEGAVERAVVHSDVPLEAIRHWQPHVHFEGWNQCKCSSLFRLQGEGEGEGISTTMWCSTSSTWGCSKWR